MAGEFGVPSLRWASRLAAVSCRASTPTPAMTAPIVSRTVAVIFNLVSNRVMSTSLVSEATLAGTAWVAFLVNPQQAVWIVESSSASGTAADAASLMSAVPNNPPAGVTPRRPSRFRNRSRARDNLDRIVPWGQRNLRPAASVVSPSSQQRTTGVR